MSVNPYIKIFSYAEYRVSSNTRRASNKRRTLGIHIEISASLE